MFDRSKAQR